MSRLLRPNTIATIGISLVLFGTMPGCTESRSGPPVALDLEIKENTIDGCTACGCRARGEVEPGGEQQWWMTFGLVASDGQGGWEANAASSHCRSGTFEEAALAFGQSVGAPYVILDLSTTAAALPDGGVELEIRVANQKLSGFDGNGRPVYSSSAQTRMLSVVSKADLILPLLIPDEREQESFAVHEVLLRVRAEVLRREAAVTYGSIAVSADVPGAEILLDGGFVGRVVEGSPTLLSNVRAGTRTIGVRDYSGREARRELAVAEGQTVEVSLEVLDATSAEPGSGLLPIGVNPQGFTEYWRVRDGAMMVTIPAGEFLMGSPDGQGEPDERPQHRVDITEFLIDKTEVSWRQLRKFTESTGSSLPREPIWGTPDNYPAAFMLWDEAKAYCQWVGGRLPSEAEWEKAARGTDGNRYPWGDEWDSRRCNSISGGLHRPESVGSYSGCVSPYGVLDMAGGVLEWCADRYGEAYYSESPSRDPKGPTEGRLRVMRGGAWMSQPTWVRAAYRSKRSPTSRNFDHGFRCARDAPE
jgi:sulfatase modifying factor 1